ncbi:uncharacterized protein LOC135200886 isoform X3 [Macrobrachium nipponense]|uniref:uncharacterized protein LOC135200886 isoform X3 n=1 Tax=Macrobrachium nipponense TaxID=159736 RepID=UPI0030C7AF28
MTRDFRQWCISPWGQKTLPCLQVSSSSGEAADRSFPVELPQQQLTELICPRIYITSQNFQTVECLLKRKVKMQSSLLLVFFALALKDVSGDKGSCDADVTVGSGSQFIKEFKQEAFQIYCKLHEGFQSLELKVEGKWRVNKTLNFTAEDFSSTNDSMWQSLGVKIDYENQFPGSVSYNWLLTVSVNQKIIKKPRYYIDWGYVFEDFKSVRVTAYGRSDWRFTEPGGNCTFPKPAGSPSEGNSTVTPEPQLTASTVWILVSVLGVTVILAALGIAILVYRIKHPKTCVRPRVNEEDEDDLHYEVRYANVGNTSVPRPGSAHDSENSLYGVV